MILPLLLLTVLSCYETAAWSIGGSNTNDMKMGLFTHANRAEWFATKTNMQITYLGCRWSYIQDDGNMGCPENDSGDGTEIWYQMANCRRANVAFAVYGSDNGSSKCSKSNFLENFVTKVGLSNFAYLMSSYDNNNVLDYDTISALPQCQYSDSGYYQAVGCSSSGSFTIDNFSDKYCSQYVSTYDNLKSVNKSLQKLSCHNCMSDNNNNDNNNGNGGNNNNNSLCSVILASSDVCSYLDSDLCSNPNGNQKLKNTVQAATSSFKSTSSFSIKAKYFFGFLFLVASFAMFVGILYTNRRKRRALLFRRSASRSQRSKSSRRHKSSSEQEGDGNGEFA